MTSPRRVLVVGLLLLLGVGAGLSRLRVRAAETLPGRLSDQEFWRLTEDLSEPNGYFQSDNLLSNEIWLQYVIPDLIQHTKPGGVYMGVGPEQNYTYIAAIKPKMAFIPDIRRGNLELQLMYKAIFELSADRADFVSRLFSKPRPGGLTTKSSAFEIFDAYEGVQSVEEDAYDRNLKAIDDQLIDKHHLPLSKDDLGGIEFVYHAFYWYGPGINYNSSNGNGGRGGNFVNYSDLMAAADGAGVNRSYLATEDNFKVVKELEEKNLIVPVVGNLGGPKAVRAIGRYLKDHGATVTAFYLSNTEQYMSRDGLLPDFCRNVASLPLDAQSTFIRSQQGGRGGFGGFSRGFGGPRSPFGSGVGGPAGGLMSGLGAMQEETKACGPSSR